MKGKGFSRAGMLFLAKFAAIFLVLYVLLFVFNPVWLENWIASLEAQWLGAQAVGNVVVVKNSSFIISESCTGIISMIILASIVFALKKPGIGKKIMLFAFGAIVLFFANLGRVYLVLLSASAFGFWAAEMLHVVSWFAMSALIIALWYYLTKAITKAKSFEEFI